MRVYDSTLYQNLTIQLKADDTFIINRDVAFLPGTNGTWELLGDFESSYSEFHFETPDVPGHENIQFGADGHVLTIESPSPKYGQPQVDLLYLVRRPQWLETSVLPSV